MGNHEKRSKPRLVSAVMIAVILMAISVGAIVVGSSMLSSMTRSPVANTNAPRPQQFQFEPVETPTVVVTEHVSQVRPTVTTTVKVRVTNVRVSAAPTVTVTAHADASPAVTKYQDRCWMWDDSQAKYVMSDCVSPTVDRQGDN